MTIEIEQEADNRWIAEVASISGALAYGQSRQEAVSRVETLVLRILADRLEHGEMAPEIAEILT
jgi:predicted RNase H-like HicB family nuclease